MRRSSARRTAARGCPVGRDARACRSGRRPAAAASARRRSTPLAVVGDQRVEGDDAVEVRGVDLPQLRQPPLLVGVRLRRPARDRLGQPAERRRAQPGEQAGGDDLGPEDERPRAAGRRRSSVSRCSASAPLRNSKNAVRRRVRPSSSAHASKNVRWPTKASRGNGWPIGARTIARCARLAGAHHPRDRAGHPRRARRPLPPRRAADRGERAVVRPRLRHRHRGRRRAARQRRLHRPRGARRPRRGRRRAAPPASWAPTTRRSSAPTSPRPRTSRACRASTSARARSSRASRSSST